MGEVGEAGETAAEAARISRRRALKAGLAAGVGAATWAAPNVKTLGMTPAYAAVCTNISQLFFSNDRNVDCSCKQAIRWHTPLTPIKNSSGVSQSGWSVVIPSGNTCSDKSVPVNITSPGYDCRVNAIEIRGGSFTYSVPSGTTALPAVGENAAACGSETPSNPPPVAAPGCVITQGPGNICNAQWRVVLECVPAGTCFPGDPI